MAELADDEFASDCLSDSVLFAAVPDSQPAIEDAQQQQEGGGTEADACDEFDGYDSDSVLDAMMQDSQSVIDDAMTRWPPWRLGLYAAPSKDLPGFRGTRLPHVSRRGQQFARCWHTDWSSAPGMTNQSSAPIDISAIAIA